MNKINNYTSYNQINKKFSIMIITEKEYKENKAKFKNAMHLVILPKHKTTDETKEKITLEKLAAIVMKIDEKLDRVIALNNLRV